MSGRELGVVLVDDEIVVTREQILKVIIAILEEKMTEMTPSSIKGIALPRKSLPYRADLTHCIYEMMKTSYENQEQIFYLSQKGSRRFGLIRWRESPEKKALEEAISGLDEFTTTEFREIYTKTLDTGRRKQMHVYLRELREDGVIERVRTGVYRKK